MPDSDPGPGEVRIRLAASGIDPGDLKKRQDTFGYGMPFPRVIPHSDGARRHRPHGSWGAGEAGWRASLGATEPKATARSARNRKRTLIAWWRPTFFCKAVWTPTGKHMAYCLMFIHLGSRKVFVSPSTYHPTCEWMQQQGRNATMWVEEEGLEMRFLVRDRDAKYTEAFYEHFSVAWRGKS